MVGAVVVQDGALVSEGHHAAFGGPHAEVVALRAAGAAARAATLYVSLEPCGHHGKTPPCAEAILEAGVTRVVYAADDPNPATAGRGPARLRSAGVRVEGGLLSDEASALNAPYEKLMTRGLPYVTCKWAMSLDGRVAAHGGEARWVTGPEARARGHRERDHADAILVGVGTVLADDPELTCRVPLGRNPRRVVLDSLARTPPVSRLATTAREVPVWLAVTSEAPAGRREALRNLGVRVLEVNERPPVDLARLLRMLGEERLTHLLVEGGPTVHGAFFDGGHVDRVLAFLAPSILGGPPGRSPVAGHGAASPSGAARLSRPRLEALGEDLLLEALVAAGERSHATTLTASPEGGP